MTETATTTAQASTDAAATAAADAAIKAAADKAAADKTAADAAAAAAGKADGTPAETGGTAGEETPQPKAPAKYVLAVPEADTALVDAADLAQLETLARASDWTNADAQAALEEHVALVRAQSDRFLAETQADPVYGGAKLNESQRLAKRVIDRVRPEGHARRESFMRFLGRGGAGNHIEVVSFMADLGALMAEDSPAHSRAAGEGSGEKKTPAQQLYPTMDQ